ncbi:hypothetical protein MAUB1S_04650 [Mycolicibacterium aubagnense]
MCFALNLHEGACYALDHFTGKSIRTIECAQAPAIANSHTGVFKVAQRLDDGVNPPVRRIRMVFTSPQRSCLTKLVD